MIAGRERKIAKLCPHPKTARPLEPIGWRAPAVRLGTRLSFRENFHLHTTIFLYRGNVTFRQRHLRCGLELAFCSAKTFILTPRFSYTAEMLLFGRGTCGATWNSSFVLRELSSSHHDVIIPRKSYFLGSTRASNERPYKQNVTSSAEDLGWRYLNPCGSTFPSVDETFPCRVMSHPRFETVAKLL